MGYVGSPSGLPHAAVVNYGSGGSSDDLGWAPSSVWGWWAVGGSRTPQQGQLSSLSCGLASLSN